MNETPRDPQQPLGQDGDALAANDPAPRDPAAGDAALRDADATTRIHEAAPAGAPKRGRGILKPVLIGSAAALTVLAVAGVGMTIADAVDDGDDPSPSATSAPLASAPAPSGSSDPTSTDAPSATDDPGATDGPSPSAELGDDRGGDDDAPAGGAASAEASDLVAAIDAAIAAAGGGSATSIEVEQGAWKVDVRLDDGSELDVRVPVSGDAVVREDDDDDRSSDVPLDPSRIAAIVDAAVAAAGGGTVSSIETEDDQVRYEVEVAVDGDDVDVELAEDLAVLSAER